MHVFFLFLMYEAGGKAVAFSSVLPGQYPVVVSGNIVYFIHLSLTDRFCPSEVLLSAGIIYKPLHRA